MLKVYSEARDHGIVDYIQSCSPNILTSRLAFNSDAISASQLPLKAEPF